MQRKTKNIIFTISILLLLGSIIYTGYLKLKDYDKNNIPSMSQTGNEPPKMPDGEEPLEKPDGGEPPEKPDGDNFMSPEMPNDNGEMEPLEEKQEDNDNNYVYLIILGLESLSLSLIVLYLVMSGFNKKTLKETFANRDKILIYLLGAIILMGGLTFTENLVLDKLNDGQNINNNFYEEDDKEDVVLDESNQVKAKEINLANEKTDVTITSSGTYTLTGNFSNSVIVDAEGEDVKLILNGVNITNEKTATIIGLKAKKITIELQDGTTNTLTDGGNSKYDGCIYSETELFFDGKGKLIVNGNQNDGEGIATQAKNMTFNDGTYIVTSNDDGLNAGGDGATITINGGTFYINASGDGIDSNKDAVINGGTIFVIGSDTGGNAGIDTDQGYTINGGLVVALGSDMLELPKEVSKQKVIAFTLDNAITKDTIITLLNDEEEIISFVSPKSFKTIIISTDTLNNGEYELYKGGKNTGVLQNGIYQNSNYTKGEKILVNNEDTFILNETINLFGNNKFGIR